MFCWSKIISITVSREFFESLSPMKRKRRRSLSQLTPAETLGQLLLNLPGNKLNNNDPEQKTALNSPSGILFGSTNGSLTGPQNNTSNTTHGTSAGFCNICQKFVSNRTNHKYVHSQVLWSLNQSFSLVHYVS